MSAHTFTTAEVEALLANNLLSANGYGSVQKRAQAVVQNALALRMGDPAPAAREAVIQAAKEWEAARSCTVTDAVGLLPDIFPPIDALSAAVRALNALEVSPAPEKSP